MHCSCVHVPWLFGVVGLLLRLLHAFGCCLSAAGQVATQALAGSTLTGALCASRCCFVVSCVPAGQAARRGCATECRHQPAACRCTCAAGALLPRARGLLWRAAALRTGMWLAAPACSSCWVHTQVPVLSVMQAPHAAVTACVLRHPLWRVCGCVLCAGHPPGPLPAAGPPGYCPGVPCCQW